MIKAIVVMGVSASGKTTVGRLLASRLGWDFAEADEFHSSANIEKMRGGKPLTDEDRAPWLAAIAKHIDEAIASDSPVVVTCSALKRRYRDVLIGARREVALVYLKGDFETIEERMRERTHAYMPPSLLKSQFEALEEPAPEENAIVLDIRRSAEALVEAISISGPPFRSPA
jgi:gluconokinase